MTNLPNLNAHQRTLLLSYGQGDYAHLIEEIEALSFDGRSVAEQADGLVEYKCGDTLVLFLWRELAKDGDTTREQYIQRLQAAIEDIETVVASLEADYQRVAEAAGWAAAGEDHLDSDFIHPDRPGVIYNNWQTLVETEGLAN